MSNDYLSNRKFFFDSTRRLLLAGIQRYTDNPHWQIDDISYLATILGQLIKHVDFMRQRYYHKEYHPSILAYSNKLHSYHYLTTHLASELLTFRDQKHEILRHLRTGLNLFDYDDFISIHYKFSNLSYQAYLQLNTPRPECHRLK